MNNCSDCSFIYELKFPIAKIVGGQMKVKIVPVFAV